MNTNIREHRQNDNKLHKKNNESRLLCLNLSINLTVFFQLLQTQFFLPNGGGSVVTPSISLLFFESEKEENKISQSISQFIKSIDI